MTRVQDDNTFANIDAWLDEHGEPDKGTLTELERDESPVGREMLLAHAVRYNVNTHAGMSAAELSDAIQLAMDQEDNEQLQ
jgi:hypothetical protein